MELPDVEKCAILSVTEHRTIMNGGILCVKYLSVNFSQAIGAIKPVNGVNNGPLTCNFSQDARPYFKEARIPFSRLHDTEYPFGAGEFVDVHCLFRNFGCDENDPANYNFTLTDEYLKAIDECGTKIIYRLGATIEHQPVKVHAVPPADYLKWARVCEHIIRHYNEGWANGLHLGVEYWEIWNEPELGGHQCWTGTPEEYCRFYITVVTYLKEKFPRLKFGGPACCSVYGDFAKQFLEALTADGGRAPLDFFSWHGYMRDPRKGARAARHLDALLKEYGYEQTESIYDEWNYVRDWSKVDESFRIIADERGAAFDAGMMCALQSSPCGHRGLLRRSDKIHRPLVRAVRQLARNASRLCRRRAGQKALLCIQGIWRTGEAGRAGAGGNRRGECVRLRGEGRGRRGRAAGQFQRGRLPRRAHPRSL